MLRLNNRRWVRFVNKTLRVWFVSLIGLTHSRLACRFAGWPGVPVTIMAFPHSSRGQWGVDGGDLPSVLWHKLLRLRRSRSKPQGMHFRHPMQRTYGRVRR